ncbi:ferritin [Lentisphaera araneosa HTCC2155]|uniref:Ferritin n=1 Tax=Lentisphaera araneosa HTCC2155 TaxID=313628 RepID=A6DT79_9BACT|nr:non-heme ferritin [Lentisphaera araneosa]EDM25152.1 ferritin [Lentisphaera araneosa HTCC2155]
MLSDKMIGLLNNQINLEFYSSNLYLQMSAWCEYKALESCAEFLRLHAEEEMTHMNRLFKYVADTGALAKIGAIDSPKSDFEDIIELFKDIYAHEQFITAQINDLAHAAFSEKDYSTFNFLQWYVGEQHEEEKLFKSILDKLEMIGTSGNSLYFFDKEIALLTNGEKSHQSTVNLFPGNEE